MITEIKSEVKLKLTGDEFYTLTCIAFHFKENLLHSEHKYTEEVIKMIEKLIEAREIKLIESD